MVMPDALKQIANRYNTAKDAILTEEATKTSLILPMIQSLGFDIYNPLEVVPEFNAEMPGTKPGDKVDYVLKKDNKVIMVIECKHYAHILNSEYESQLTRYFNALSPGVIGVLTNGISYQFYADLCEKNKMDPTAFFQFDVTNVTDNETQMKELDRFTKNNFNIDSITQIAEDMKYTKGVKDVFHKTLSDPEDWFIRAIADSMYKGRLTEKIMGKFRTIIPRAFSSFISERVQDRINAALLEEKNEQDTEKEAYLDTSRRVVTTQEELDAFSIIKCCVRDVVSPKRIFFRDFVNHACILLDDNLKQTLVKLYFNVPEDKQIGIFDAERTELRNRISTMDDIYSMAELLSSRIKSIVTKVDTPELMANSVSEEVSFTE